MADAGDDQLSFFPPQEKSGVKPGLFLFVLHKSLLNLSIRKALLICSKINKSDLEFCVLRGVKYKIGIIIRGLSKKRHIRHIRSFSKIQQSLIYQQLQRFRAKKTLFLANLAIPNIANLLKALYNNAFLHFINNNIIIILLNFVYTYKEKQK